MCPPDQPTFLHPHQPYNPVIALNLGPALEQRIQQVVARGTYCEPAQVPAHAVDLIDAEEEALSTRRTELLADLSESIAHARRGEGYTEDQLRSRIAARHATLSATKA